MHPSSLENMQHCFDRFLLDGYLDERESVSVLDLGSMDVNGSYRDIFQHPKIDYIGADLTPGKGVDLVLEDPYRIPLADSSVDVVVSGQMLEHCEFFWLTFQEMSRVVTEDGFIFLIAPSAGPIHRYPVDCYRFYPDAYRALAKMSGCHLLEWRLDERGPWHDLVGIFSKKTHLEDAVATSPDDSHPGTPSHVRSGPREAIWRRLVSRLARCGP